MDYIHSYRFPYIVEKYASTVYRIIDIDFAEQMSEKSNQESLTIEEKDPFTNGFLKEEVRSTIIEIISKMSAKNKKSMCAVFDTKDCVYLEPDGSIKKSDNPPSGGIDMFDTFSPPVRVLDGLEQCKKCGYFNGNCIQSETEWEVTCCCSTNTCSRCKMPIYKYKIGSNMFDLQNGQCWRIPVFCAWGHTCPDGIKSQLPNSFLIPTSGKSEKEMIQSLHSALNRKSNP